MRHHQAGQLAFSNDLHDQFFGFQFVVFVQGRGRFVQQQDFGAIRQSARQRDALGFTAR